jgi:hypothetical protein
LGAATGGLDRAKGEVRNLGAAVSLRADREAKLKPGTRRHT